MPKTRPVKRTPELGLTHAYIGYGKGKTTAAIGVAVRARGYGWPVLFLQFMKSEDWASGERAALKKLGVTVKVMGAGFYKIMGDRQPAQVHRRAAARAMKTAAAALKSGKYRLVILDELGTAVDEGLLAAAAVEAKLFKRHPAAVNVIWTGHRRIPRLLKHADLVTDMRVVKHPYNRGILARQGIDY
jgi:cob(I)alamin adenosyltransferase